MLVSCILKLEGEVAHYQLLFDEIDRELGELYFERLDIWQGNKKPAN